MLRVGPRSELPSVLRLLRYDPESVLHGSGISLSSFANLDTRIPFRLTCELLEHCAKQVECAHLGLLIGSRYNLRTLGALGLLLKYSPDVGTALRSLIRYQRYQVEGADISLSEAGESAVLSYRINDLNVGMHKHLENGVVAALCAVLRDLLGADWNPLQVSFAHDGPEEQKPFREFFRCPIVFSSGVSELAFHSNHLHRRLDRHDPDVHDYMRGQLEGFAPIGENVAAQVLKLLQTIIPNGCVRSEQIANLMHVHPRTLHRRLRDSGTNFRELLDQARYGLACRMLDQQKAAVFEVAEALGYSEPSAFARAFRRWSGVGPGEWRNRAIVETAR